MSSAHLDHILRQKQFWTGRDSLAPIPQRNGVRSSSEKYASQMVREYEMHQTPIGCDEQLSADTIQSEFVFAAQTKPSLAQG